MKRTNWAIASYLLAGASFVVGSYFIVIKRKKLKRLLDPFNAYLSNNLFRKNTQRTWLKRMMNINPIAVKFMSF
jgi:hypothetical protein